MRRQPLLQQREQLSRRTVGCCREGCRAIAAVAVNWLCADVGLSLWRRLATGLEGLLFEQPKSFCKSPYGVWFLWLRIIAESALRLTATPRFREARLRSPTKTAPTHLPGRQL